MSDILDDFLNSKVTGPATVKHGEIAEKLRERILDKANRYKIHETNPERIAQGLEPYNLHEIKQFEVVNYGGKQTFVLIETGLEGDEGSYASIFCRDRRHIAISKNGGLTLLNAKRKRESLGWFHAVHSLTK